MGMEAAWNARLKIQPRRAMLTGAWEHEISCLSAATRTFQGFFTFTTSSSAQACRLTSTLGRVVDMNTPPNTVCEGGQKSAAVHVKNIPNHGEVNVPAIGGAAQPTFLKLRSGRLYLSSGLS